MGHVFRDNKGREWIIELHHAAMKRVRTLLDVNLVEAVTGNLIERLTTDPVLLCDVVYALVKPAADAAGVDAEAFGVAMGGDCIANATEALLDELIRFFPNAKMRANLSKIREAMATLVDRQAEATSQRIDHLVAEALKKLAPPQPPPASSDSSTNPPASSE